MLSDIAGQFEALNCLCISFCVLCASADTLSYKSTFTATESLIIGKAIACQYLKTPTT